MDLIVHILEQFLDWLGLPKQSLFMWEVFAMISAFLVYALLHRRRHGSVLTAYFVVGGISLGIFLFSNNRDVNEVALIILIVSMAGALSWDLFARRGG